MLGLAHLVAVTRRGMVVESECNPFTHRGVIGFQPATYCLAQYAGIYGFLRFVQGILTEFAIEAKRTKQAVIIAGTFMQGHPIGSPGYFDGALSY